jgi:prepilin-type N-terminal cleavage/methylation domain-containing protein
MIRKRHICERKAVSRVAGAFTLVEMLTVIAIIGIIAAISVPVLKNFGKSNISVSASRQLLDDIGRARQLAMSQRTTVYMVFISTNFWNPVSGYPDPNGPLFPSGVNYLNYNQRVALTNLLGMQLTGYTYMAYGALGDQPGQHQWHFLAPWQSLPAGVYIPMWKFYNPAGPNASYNFSDPANNNASFNIHPFSVTNTFPFPTDDSTNSVASFGMMLPFIAFNYQGQLANYSGQLLPSANQDQDFTGGGIDIPIVQGSVLSPVNPSTRAFNVGPPQVNEMPPGNGTNISYNVVHIDPLTGRSTLEFHKLQ